MVISSTLTGPENALTKMFLNASYMDISDNIEQIHERSWNSGYINNIIGIAMKRSRPCTSLLKTKYFIQIYGTERSKGWLLVMCYI